MPSRFRRHAAPALAFFVALPFAAADGPAPDFPANTAPRTDIAPARGIPAYDDNPDAPKPDRNPDPDDPTGDASSPSSIPEQYRYAMTFVTPLAVTVEQRIPVAMNSGETGRMSEWSYGAGTSLQHVTPDLVAYASFDYRRMDFSFSGVQRAPWGDLDLYRLSGHVEKNVGGDWWLFADGGLKLGADQNASLGDAFTGTAAVGAMYRFSPEFSYYFGLTVMTQLDQHPLIFPMTAFDIRLGRWEFRSLNGLIVTYDLTGDNNLVLDASVLYEDTDFRLANDASAPGRRQVEFQEVPVSFGITKNFEKFGFVRVYAACIAWSDYRFHSDGTTTGDFQTSPGLLFGLSFGAKF